MTAYRLESGRWLELGVFGGEREASIELFVAVPIDVARFWVDPGDELQSPRTSSMYGNVAGDAPEAALTLR